MYIHGANKPLYKKKKKNRSLGYIFIRKWRQFIASDTSNGLVYGSQKFHNQLEYFIF